MSGGQYHHHPFTVGRSLDHAAEPSDAGDVAGAFSFESFINLEARVNRPRA